MLREFTTHEIAGEWFRANQVGINTLKDEFFDEAIDQRLTFVYFRKGEWTGVRESAEHASKRRDEKLGVLFTPKAMNEPPRRMIPKISKDTGVQAKYIDDTFFLHPSSDKHLTVRVITGTGTGSGPIAEWESICGKGGVATIPPLQIGSFRYLVNDKRYAIFSRIDKNDLRGIVGNDPDVIALLRAKFDDEFIRAHLQASQQAIETVQTVCSRFPYLAKRLAARHDNRAPLDIADEYDVQDILHGVLSLHFNDVRPEEWTPSYAGSHARMDFLLKQEKLVIEVKRTRKGLGQKEVVEQLAVDKQHYRAHGDCRTLVCFVYDPEGRCGNPDALENDVSEEIDGLRVVVIVSPKGL